MQSVVDRIFVIPGMTRTATTFLYHIFQTHPSIFLPYRKEINYFCVDYEKGADWYLKFYKNMHGNQIGADISPTSFFDPDSIKRIKSFNPNIKIIMGIRLPSDWIISMYSQILTMEWQVPSFEDFLKGYGLNVMGIKTIRIDINNEFIIRTIEEYKRAFGDNLLLYQYEFFKQNPLKVVNSIEKFIGLTPYFNERNFNNTIINAGNRRQIKMIPYLLQRKWVVPILVRLIPEPILKLSRKLIETKLGKKIEGKSEVYTSENIELAKKTLFREDAYATELFSKHKIHRGDGSPFGHFDNP